MQIDLRVMELLASKVCHDLVSPISAINNGVELIEDIGGDVVDEAMKLIGDSAHNASRRLRLFRVAYGRAGSEENIPVREVKQIAEQHFIGSKVLLHWSEDQPAVALAEHKGFLKTLLNIILLGDEALAYGGVITLRSVTEDDRVGCRLEIVGRSAHLAEAYRQALDNEAEINALTPRTIQAYISGRLAEHFGLALTYDQSIADRLDLNLFAKASGSKSKNVLG